MLYFMMVLSALFHFSSVDVQACYSIHEPPHPLPGQSDKKQSGSEGSFQAEQAVYRPNFPQGKQVGANR